MKAAHAPRWARLLDFVGARWKRLAVTLALLLVFFGNQGFKSLVKNYLQLRAIRTEIASLKKEEKHHAERLKLLSTGDQAVERMARRELGYLRKGEIEYRFPPPK